MPPFGYKRVNMDGSRNIWCSDCRRYIGTASAMTAINTATCALCQAEKEGIELTEEQARELRNVRIGEYTVAEIIAFPPPVVDPMQAESPDSIDLGVGRVGYYVKALVRNIRAGVEVVKEAVSTPVYDSKKVAKANKRTRLFELPIDDENKK
jgi:hypothetical protein